MALALARIKTMPKRVNKLVWRCTVIVLTRFLSLLKVDSATVPHPLKTVTANGMHVHPRLARFFSLFLILKSSAVDNIVSGDVHASFMLV